MIPLFFQFDLNDELPKYLCQTCFVNLDKAYKFKILCEYTDLKFRDTLERLKRISIPESKLNLADDIKLEEMTIKLNQGAATIPDEEFIGDDDKVYYVDNLIDDCETQEDLQGETKYDIQEEEQIFADPFSLPTENCDKEDEEEEQITGDIVYDNTDKELHQTYSSTSGDEDESKTISKANKDEITIDCTDDENLSEHYLEYENDDKSSISSVDSEPNKIKSNNSSSSKVKNFKCDTCGEVFDNFNKCNDHKKTHGKQRYQCPTCSKWFAKRYHMKNHMEIHLGNRNYECVTCHKKYSNPGNLDRHVRVFHYKEKSYFCKLCGKGFSQTTTLKQHQAVHIEERNFACDICEKSFKTQDHLSLHKSRHFQRDKSKRTAQRRRKTSNSSDNPVEQQPAVKKYKQKPKVCVCLICGKVSNSDTLHKSHQRTHTKEQPYECQFCKKKFSFQQSLKSHLLLHTGEKPFRCDDCGATFRQIGHLKGHELVHTGVKQHKCEYCDKTFALRGNLTVHRRLHTGETPYQCLLCSKKFYDSNGLKRHKKVHTQGHNNIVTEDDDNNVSDDKLFECSKERMELETSNMADNDLVVHEQEEYEQIEILSTLDDYKTIQMNEIMDNL